MVRRARRLTAVRFPQELLDAMRQIRERDGLGITWQMEHAIRDFLKRRGITLAEEQRVRKVRSERKRVTARRRP